MPVQEDGTMARMLLATEKDMESWRLDTLTELLVEDMTDLLEDLEALEASTGVLEASTEDLEA